MEKQDDVNIINIIEQNGKVLGLGDDSKVYLWNPTGHTWTIWASTPSLDH